MKHPPNTIDQSSLLRMFWTRLRFWLLIMLLILGAGASGFRLLEHITWLESAYRSVCVLLTLGLTTSPANPQSMGFTIVLALAGIGSLAYAIGAVGQIIVAEEFQRALAQRKGLRRMRHLRDHFIICGFGRIGQIIARQMRRELLPYVVVERDHELFTLLEEEGFTGLHGDASHDEVLEKAGLHRARGVIVATSSDAENILITMTAHQLNAEVPLIVRCDEEINATKFVRAGATRVITPNTTGAQQMALAAVRPHVTDLLDLASGSKPQPFQIRELRVPRGSRVAGQSLKELALGAHFGVIIIGIKSTGHEILFNPSADARLTPDDVLISVGKEEKLKELEKFLAEE